MYLGIDGGGTKTKLILINDNNEIIGETIKGPSSVDTVSFEVSKNAICEGWKTIKESLTYTPKLKGVFGGLGGIVHQWHSDKLIEMLKKAQVFNTENIVIKNDMYNALASGYKTKDAMTVIIGTGMVAFGIDIKEKTHKSGGWGYKEGDTGSAYSLGYHAIRKMVRAYDGRIDQTKFTEEIFNTLNLTHIDAFVDVVENWVDNRTKLASLAPIVTKHANHNDPHALKIIDFCTDELANAVKAVYQTLEFVDPTLVVVGSLGNAEGKFKSFLHQKINEIGNIKIISPIHDPAFGAALLAKQ